MGQKVHTSIKNIRQYWGYVFRCGYCDLQYIMHGYRPQMYNSGVYGWNCDIYIDYTKNIAITTGYRNLAGRLIPEALIEKYSEKAKEIIDLPFNYKGKDEMLDENREAFFKELLTI